MKTFTLISFFALTVLTTEVWSQNASNTLPTQGNVGLGTGAPQAKLQVNGRVQIDSSLVVSDSVTIQSSMRVEGETRIDGHLTVSGQITSQALLNTPVSCGGMVGVTPTGTLGIFTPSDCPDEPVAMPAWMIFGNYLNSNNNFIGTRNPYDFNIKTNNAYRLTVTAAGNVGIGTRTPGSLFEISKSDPIDLKVNVTDFKKATIWTMNSAFGYGFGVDANGKGHIYANFNSPQPVMTFQNGAVGIGTQNPASSGYLLSVNGSLRAKKIVVEGGWADYVFDDDYKLMSISELRTYVKKYRHLPGVPSAKEIEENGIDLTEANRMLLEKVEELTLYVIRLEEKIEELK